MTKREEKLIAFLKKVPKVEIHAHMEAMTSLETIFQLNRKYKVNPYASTKADLHYLFEIDSLNAMIQSFLFFQSCIQDEQDFIPFMNDVKQYLIRNKIVYSELFLSPSMFIKHGLKFDLMLNVIEGEIEKIKADTGFVIKLIIDVSRTFGLENAMNNLNYTIARKSNHIIGIGLGGAEKKNKAVKFKEVFQKARAEGLKVVAHAGEEDVSESIWSALNDLGASRIGHGTSAVKDPKLLTVLREKQIPLEICPTSNVITGKYVQNYKMHPLRSFFDEGLFVTLNTDDPVLFNVELNEEYHKVFKYQNFSVEEVILLMQNNVYATFLSETAKKNLWAKIFEKIKKAYREVYEKELRVK